jgi:hypothetical protein
MPLKTKSRVSAAMASLSRMVWLDFQPYSYPLDGIENCKKKGTVAVTQVDWWRSSDNPGGLNGSTQHSRDGDACEAKFVQKR